MRQPAQPSPREPMDTAQTELFARLWVGAQSTLAGFVHSLVPDFQQAEEVLQRVAVTLVRKFDHFDQTRSFAAWAIGVAKYEVLYFRRERATDRHVFDDEIIDNIAQGYQRFVNHADPFREALEGCLDKLDGRAKQAIKLHYAEELTSPAVATEMRLSPGAVRMLLSRARRTLRTCIERQIQRIDGTQSAR